MPFQETLVAALERGLDWVRSRQLGDGSWSEPVYDDPRATAIYLNFLKFMRIGAGDTGEAMELYLADLQESTGTWEAWPGSGADIEVTALCAMALEDARTTEGRRAEEKARDWLERQPVPEIDGFWFGNLAMSGALDWKYVPYLSPRLVSVPKWLHPNIYDFGVIRLSFVAMSIVSYDMAQRPKAQRSMLVHTPKWRKAWADEARATSRRLLPSATRFLRWLDTRLAGSARHRDKALNWLLAHQEEDGSFFSSLHMTTAGLMALHVADAERYAAQINKGLKALRAWQFAAGRGLRQSFTDSTIWDTALFMQLLQSFGDERDAPRVQAARRFLMEAQIFGETDCMVRMKKPKRGGWSFQRIARHYPDVDDTTVSLTALLPMADGDEQAQAKLRAAVEWLISMQGANGGWASWDKNDRGWICLMGGGRWFLRDVPCPVLTARAAKLLAQIGRGEFAGMAALQEKSNAAALRGFQFVADQQVQGLWICRWFTHFIYGTLYGLENALEMNSATRSDIEAIVEWYASIAQEDGGFGESPKSLVDRRFVSAPSTPFHTASALLALVRADAADHPVAKRAARWLIEHQKADGRWQNDDFFAAGIPSVWYTNFSGTPQYYALKSLAAYQAALDRAYSKSVQGVAS